MEPTTETAPTANGYSLVLPPGWSKIPLRQGTEEAIRDVVKQSFNKAPDDVSRDALSKHRVKIEGHLREMASQSAENGGLDLYLPTAPRGETLVAGSIIISEIQLSGGPVLDTNDVAARLAAGSETHMVTVDGARGARGERIVSASSADAADASRRVDYALPVPGDPNRWITAVFSTPADGDPAGEFADILVELFDAIMTTFRWTKVGP
ncbi:hypothetical protein ABZU86_10295 [Streptomyces sp. NPDC005271]|uniref:hypothetical protein n=1 Tax=unclassified Streptomyces TaxID=2593676 RepID=UPI0033B356F8